MTASDHSGDKATSAEVAREIAVEQAHVDLVYAELAKAQARAGLVEADGLARGRTDRTGDVRDEELTGLFERDALVFNAARRRSTLDTQYEGLVFGRLDLDHAISRQEAPPDRETRYIGRLGVRDDDYEPLVVDWRAPAAAAFYRATPVEPMDVLRRRVLRCKGPDVVGVEDDLMVAEAPDDLVVVGDGALLAALTRSRGARMRDIVATIQRHQDEAIRASARGVTEITGGPGTGKTVVALHRAAYLLYSDRRRFESGGILVVGPSAAYTAYIERVLPSLGEESVTLRSLGDIVDGVTATRLDAPEVAAVKGSTRIRRLLARAAADVPPGAPDQFRAFVNGKAVRVERAALDRIRAQVLRNHQRNLAGKAVRTALAEAAWAGVREGERAEFMDRFADHLEVETFLEQWWPQVDPREVLLWLADRDRARRHGQGVLTPAECDAFAASIDDAARSGSWSVADAALVDDLAARLGPVQEGPAEERGFYEIEELDDVSGYGVDEVRAGRQGRRPGGSPVSVTASSDPRERLLHGRVEGPGEYAHVLVDEAQDLSPMQWRMLGRRGRYSSWTVVGDAAQASWPDAEEARQAREEAFGTQERRMFHMDTNYRNAREIFDYAAKVVKAQVPDADIPQAVRETGVEPVELAVPSGQWLQAATDAVEALLAEVEGSVALVTPALHAQEVAGVSAVSDRVVVIDPMSTKGLEYDATVIVDPDRITAESPGGVRVLYVALTRAAHRMTVLRPA
ncbi:HelD family protein [Pedococcus sp. 5OH_020]|uniref:HelD family protein n=1 Tax=Pedococcus sp. 5OH_020 TaxID=2989814 RepID=UPI0022EA06C3|nr:AAA family ATPase [Pedococcus sp. 5OH_020]